MYTYYPESNLDIDVKSRLVTVKCNKHETNLLLYSYKQIQKKEDITIEGYVDFHKWKSADSEFVLHLVDVGDLHVEPKSCKASWCIDVGKGRYLLVKHKNPLWVLLLPIILLLIIVFVWKGYSAGSDSIGLADQSRYTGTESSRKPGEVLYTEFPGYTECYVDDTKDTIQLYNPESNSYYLSYSIFSTDDNTCVLEDTGLIEPGKAYLWKAAENLSKGDHNVYFNIRSFSMEDPSVEGTSTTVQNITVHVY